MEESKRDIPDHSHPCLVTVQDGLAFSLTEHSVFRPPSPPAVQENITTENSESRITSAKVVGCSDSSVDPLEGVAAYSWVLTNTEEKGKVIWAEPTKISPDDMTSFRSELTRVHSIVNYTVKN